MRALRTLKKWKCSECKGIMEDLPTRPFSCLLCGASYFFILQQFHITKIPINQNKKGVGRFAKRIKGEL